MYPGLEMNPQILAMLKQKLMGGGGQAPGFGVSPRPMRPIPRPDFGPPGLPAGMIFNGIPGMPPGGEMGGMPPQTGFMGGPMGGPGHWADEPEPVDNPEEDIMESIRERLRNRMGNERMMGNQMARPE